MADLIVRLPASLIRSFTALLVVAGFTVPLGAQATHRKDPPVSPRWSEAVAVLDSFVTADAVVGAALVMVRDGQIVEEHYLGWSDQERQVPAVRGTVWHWGSITKTLTAVAAMQQRERGRLTLESRVTEWLPELRQIHNPYGSMDDLTVRMLLSHTSGLPGGTWPWTRGEAWEPFEPTRYEQLVAMMPYQRLAFAPGTEYRYSNPALLYLARIVELITNDPWQGYVQKNLFAPLGITESSFGTTPYHLAPRRSHGYTVLRNGSGNVVRDNGADFDPGITIPNGGWNAPVSDLALWAGFLMGSASPARQTRFDAVLPRSTLESMWTPVIATGEEDRMGLSFFLRGTGADRVIGHTGTQGGFRSFLWVRPGSRTAIIGVVNTSNEVAPERSDEGFREVMAAARGVLR
ncbi:MAG: serine hydrolase domain-containing protein [Gemmatimonadales bacterium]|nr:serine hydrolase domain-containing protein [Gemmatimonadales bacterium]MDZ4388816.1 serine hydrolase domain-containing protein [Gemmatimonadales bacterium]